MSNENQHWVPKFLIKNFVASDGRVFRFDIHTGEVTKSPPRLAASDFGFNEFLIDGKAVSFEDRLEKIETRAAPTLKPTYSGPVARWPYDPRAPEDREFRGCPELPNRSLL